MTTLFHGTSRKALKSIKQEGIKPPSHWGTERVADYYAKIQADRENSQPVLIGVTKDELKHFMKPDLNSIREPLTYTLNTTEEDVWKSWEASDQTAEDSLRLVESVTCDQTIPPEAIDTVIGDGKTSRIARRYLRRTANRDIPPVVYHATPHPRSILQEGFKLREEQTFGGHEAEYISTTTKEHAKNYALGLKTAASFLQRKIDWKDMKETYLKNFGASESDWKAKFQGGDVFHWVVKKETSEDTQEAIWNMDIKKRTESIIHHAIQQTIPGEGPTDREMETKRRWSLISGLWQGSEFPLFFGSTAEGPPKNLMEIDPSSVGVVEADVKEEASLGKQRGIGVDEGNVTYNGAENEWRFWDPSLLEPVNIIWNLN